MIKVCTMCGLDYITNDHRRKHCNEKCYWTKSSSRPNSGTFKKGQVVHVPSEKRVRGEANHKWKGGPIEKACQICQRVFHVDRYRSSAKTCSVICNRLYRKTSEFRQALSRAQRAKVPAKHIFIRSFTSLLKTCSRYFLWREEILKRDDYTCQLCSKRGGKLQVDHINPFIKIILDNKIENYEQALSCKELWDTENGRTLCLPCHYKTPTFGSKVLKILK